MKKTDFHIQNKSVSRDNGLSWNRNTLIHLMGGIHPVETSKKKEDESDVKSEQWKKYGR